MRSNLFIALGPSTIVDFVYWIEEVSSFISPFFCGALSTLYTPYVIWHAFGISLLPIKKDLWN